MPSSYLNEIQSGKTPDQRFNQIIEQGMCIGCGICRGALPAGKIALKMVESEYVRPVIETPLEHAEVDFIMDICPGTKVEGLPADEVDESSHNDDVWGVWKDIYYSHAADPGVPPTCH